MFNKLILIGLALVLWGFKLNAQTPVNEVAPDYFKNYYRINTNYSRVFDKSSSGNVYQHGYHGGSNQQWLVMPLKPNSADAVIINKAGGVLDRHHGGNLYCGSFHGGANQVFRFDKKSNGEVIIVCDNGRVGDISMSSKSRDVFNYPSSHGGNLYAGTRHEGDNQRFDFVAIGAIPNSEKLENWKLFPDVNNVKIDNPPAPESVEDNTISATTPLTHIATTYIPCFYVNDGRTFDFKIDNSPYYIIKQYAYYELIESYVASAQLGITKSYGIKRGISQSTAYTLSNTLGITHKSDGGVEGNLNVTTTFTQGLVVNNTTSQTYEETTNTQISNAAGEECRVWLWQLKYKYELIRMNESYPLYEWVVNSAHHQYLAYPKYLDISTSTLKSANTEIDYSYEIRLAQNTLPFAEQSTNSGKTNAWDVSGSDGADKTFKIYLAETTTLNVSTDYPETDFDTKIEIFKSDHSTTGFYNDDASDYQYSNRYVSKLNNIILTAGYYYIVVDGYSGREGNFKLSVMDSEYRIVPFIETGSNIGQANNWDVNGSDGADYTYKFYIPNSGNLNVNTCLPGTNYDTKIEIFNLDGSRTGFYIDDGAYGCSYHNYASNYTGYLSEGFYNLVVDGYSGQTGNFEVEAQLNLNKSAKINSEFKLLSDTDDLGKLNGVEFEVNIYPNPAQTSFTVNLSQNNNAYLRLFDMQGKVVKEFTTKQLTTRIDCSNLASGLYNLHILNGENSTIKKLRFPSKIHV